MKDHYSEQRCVFYISYAGRKVGPFTNEAKAREALEVLKHLISSGKLPTP